MRRIAVLGAALSLLCAANCSATPVLWPLEIGGNGHYYDVVDAPAVLTWDNAKLAASSLTYNGRTGFLATMTTAQENAFVVAQFGDAVRGTYLGGFQAADGIEPSGGWQWITTEPWAYTNWAPTEPNNSGGNEDHLMFATAGGLAPGIWNDINGTLPVLDGYVVEFVPEPSAMLLAALGIATFGVWRWRRRV